MLKASLTRWGWVLVATTILFTYNICFGKDFKAKITFSESNQSMTGMIYVKNSRYRMEEKENGENVVILVNQETGITRVLIPSKKMYLEMQNNDPRSLMNDPFQGVKYTETRIKPKKSGVETVNGYECDRYIFEDQGKKLITEWISPSLGFPIKMTNHASNSSVELKNIEVGTLDDSLFEPPRGYSKMGTAGPVHAAKSLRAETQTSRVQEKPTTRQSTKVHEFHVKGEGRKTDVSSTEKTVDPDKNLIIRITGDCPVRPESKGKFSVYRQGYQKVLEVQFVLKNGETKTWEFPTEKHIKYVLFGIYGTGETKVSIQQGNGATGQGAAKAKPTKKEPVRQETVASVRMSQVPSSSFSSLLDNARKSYSNNDSVNAVLDLRKAILSVWDSVPLTVINAVLIKDTNTYAPKPDNIYRADESIYVHCQILGHTLKKVGNVYHVGLGADFVVMSEDGNILGGKENVLTIEKTTPLPNTEFYLDLTYTISGLQDGTYKIKTTIHDRNSGKSTTFIKKVQFRK